MQGSPSISASEGVVPALEKHHASAIVLVITYFSKENHEEQKLVD